MKKTLLEVAAREMAAGLYEAGVIDATKMREYEYICTPEYKLNHIPNAETRKAIEEADKGIGLRKFKNLDDFFKEINSTDDKPDD